MGRDQVICVYPSKRICDQNDQPLPVIRGHTRTLIYHKKIRGGGVYSHYGMRLRCAGEHLVLFGKRDVIGASASGYDYEPIIYFDYILKVETVQQRLAHAMRLTPSENPDPYAGLAALQLAAFTSVSVTEAYGIVNSEENKKCLDDDVEEKKQLNNDVDSLSQRLKELEEANDDCPVIEPCVAFLHKVGWEKPLQLRVCIAGRLRSSETQELVRLRLLDWTDPDSSYLSRVIDAEGETIAETLGKIVKAWRTSYYPEGTIVYRLTWKGVVLEGDFEVELPFFEKIKNLAQIVATGVFILAVFAIVAGTGGWLPLLVASGVASGIGGGIHFVTRRSRGFICTREDLYSAIELVSGFFLLSTAALGARATTIVSTFGMSDKIFKIGVRIPIVSSLKITSRAYTMSVIGSNMTEISGLGVDIFLIADDLRKEVFSRKDLTGLQRVLRSAKRVGPLIASYILGRQFRKKTGFKNRKRKGDANQVAAGKTVVRKKNREFSISKKWDYKYWHSRQRVFTAIINPIITFRRLRTLPFSRLKELRKDILEKFRTKKASLDKEIDDTIQKIKNNSKRIAEEKISKDKFDRAVKNSKTLNSKHEKLLKDRSRIIKQIDKYKKEGGADYAGTVSVTIVRNKNGNILKKRNGDNVELKAFSGELDLDGYSRYVKDKNRRLKTWKQHGQATLKASDGEAKNLEELLRVVEEENITEGFIEMIVDRHKCGSCLLVAEEFAKKKPGFTIVITTLGPS